MGRGWGGMGWSGVECGGGDDGVVWSGGGLWSCVG